VDRNICEINESQHFSGGAEENHRKPQRENPSDGKRSQSETFRTRNTGKTPGRSNVTCR